MTDRRQSGAARLSEFVVSLRPKNSGAQFASLVGRVVQDAARGSDAAPFSALRAVFFQKKDGLGTFVLFLEKRGLAERRSPSSAARTFFQKKRGLQRVGAQRPGARETADGVFF